MTDPRTNAELIQRVKEIKTSVVETEAVLKAIADGGETIELHQARTNYFAALRSRAELFTLAELLADRLAALTPPTDAEGEALITRLRSHAVEFRMTAKAAARAGNGATAAGLSLYAKANDEAADALTTCLRQRDTAREERWTCFHCGDTFTDRAEAAIHFGYSEQIISIPACRLSLADVRLLRDLEREIVQVRRENTELENDSRLWHESQSDRVRRIGHVEWWQELDSREGERLVLTAERDALQQENERLRRTALSVDALRCSTCVTSAVQPNERCNRHSSWQERAETAETLLQAWQKRTNEAEVELSRLSRIVERVQALGQKYTRECVCGAAERSSYCLACQFKDDLSTALTGESETKETA